MAGEDREFRDQLNKFKSVLAETFGDAIRKPVPAKLGHKDANGQTFIKVPDERTDQPDRYYFHAAGGNSFQGEAFMQPGALAEWQIRYGAPVRIRRDPLSGEWEIIGIDARFAAQYFDGVDQIEDAAVIPYSQVGVGMLTQTTPPSMRALVLEGFYRIGQEQVWSPGGQTADFSLSPQAANIPTTPNKARWALVQFNFDTEALSYKYGTQTTPAYLTFPQVYALEDAAVTAGTYLPSPDDRCFRCGYIKLVYGMTRILRRGHLWSYPELLTLGGGTASEETIEDILDRIVTIRSTGEVAVMRSTGNVVYTRNS